MPDLSALGIKISSTGVVKTTKELTEFSKAATAARNAAKNPIAIKVTGSSAKALGEIRSLQRALTAIRASARGGLAIRIATGGSAAAIRDIARMGTSIREARAAARSPINVRVQATGVNETIAQLQRLLAQIERARRETGRGAGGGGGGGPSGSDVSAVNSMKSAVLGLVSAYALLRGAQAYARLTDESKMFTAQLRLATAEVGSFVKAQEDVRRISADARSDLDSTAKLYSRLIAGSRDLGINQAEVAKITEAVGKSFKVSGASTVETTQGIRQLIQALQSGTLRGDEFNTIMEAAPRLQKAFLDELNKTGTGARKTGGDLRKMAEDGELTTKFLTSAILGASDKINAEFEQMPVTFGDAMQQIHNAAVITFGAFDDGGEFSKAIVNFLIGGSKGLADMEARARDMGITLRGVIDGVRAAFAPFISDLEKMNFLLGEGQASSSDMGFGKTLQDLDKVVAMFDRLEGWASRNAWWSGGGARVRAPEETFFGRYQNARNESERTRTGNMLADEVSNRAREAAIRQRDRDTKATAASTTETKKNTKAKDDGAKAAENLAKRLAREREANEALIKGLYASAAGYAKSASEGKKAEIAAEAMAKGIKAQSKELDAYVNQALRKYVAEQNKASSETLRNLLDQTSLQKKVNADVKSGVTSVEDAAQAYADLNEQLKLKQVYDLAVQNGDTDGIRVAAENLLALANAQKEANKASKEATAIQNADRLKRETGEINKLTEAQREAGEARIAALKGLSGDALEDELARISNEYEVQVIWLRAQAEAALDAANATHILAKAQAEIAQVRQGQGQDTAERVFERNRQRAIDAAQDIANLIGGGIGRAASALIDVLAEMTNVFGELGKAFGGVFEALSKNMKLGGAFGNLTGSSSGGAIGGGIGGALGKEFLTKGLDTVFKGLGKFAGPIGAIAGGLIGGIIGGILKKTPKASATISFIAGEAMDTAITGNKAKLKKAVGQMAGGIIDSLSDLATQLGAELTGNASVSVGIRKGQYRVDPTGQGRTKGAGVIDFGEDQAAAIAYAMLDAIKDGVLNVTGSVKTLLTLTDDLSTNVAKVQQFNSVFDELLQMTDPQAFDNQALDKWRTAMDKLFAEAGATAEELAKLEELTGLKRAEIVEKYAQEVIQNEEQKRQLEIEIMQLQGKEVEALAASRALEYAEMDEATRALAETRDALLDWVAAVEKAKGIFAAQTSIEQEILGLRAQLVKGEEQAALQALALKLAREAELRAADATLVPLLELKYALEDQVVAAQAVAAAEQELIDARKAQEDEVKGLNRQWLELIGDTKTLREMDLAALLSDDARELQKRIWDYQDAQAAAAKAAEKAAAAEQARADAIASARDTLTQAYERESGALQEAIDKFKGFAESIAEFRKSLYTSNNPLASYAQIRGQFQNTARIASMGDEKSLGAFATDAQAYLDAALQNAGSRLEYDRIVAQVAQAAMRAEGGALGVASEAQQQVDLLKELVGGTIDVSDQVVSVVDALAALQALERDTTTPAMVTAIADLSNIIASGNVEAGEADTERGVELRGIYDQLEALNARMRSWDDGGMARVTIDADGPAKVTVV